MARKKSFDVTDDIRFQNTRVQPVNEEAAAEGTTTPGYTMLSAKDIQPSPFNEGLSKENIDSYVESMKETGIIEPIVVYDLGNGKYEILSGHQRFEAWCNRLGNKTIRAVILPYEKDPVKRFKAHTEANVLTRNKDLRFWLSRINHAKQVLHESGFVGSKAEELKKISEMLAVSLDAQQQMEVAERVRALQRARMESNPELLDDMEVTREEFSRIVTDVRKGKKTESAPRKKSTYSERVDKAYQGFIKTISKSRTQSERKEALEYIAKLRLQLEELEKELS